MDKTSYKNLDQLKLSIQESNKLSDFLRYMFLVVREGLSLWNWYILLVKLFGGKTSKIFVIKNGDSVIGGFGITNFQLPKYKSYNWFRKDVQQKIDELANDGYQYFCCFVVEKEWRSKGVGTFVFDTYLNKEKKKIWFTSSKKAVPFYLRNGATIFYKTKYDMYTYDGANTTLNR